MSRIEYDGYVMYVQNTPTGMRDALDDLEKGFGQPFADIDALANYLSYAYGIQVAYVPFTEVFAVGKIKDGPYDAMPMHPQWHCGIITFACETDEQADAVGNAFDIQQGYALGKGISKWEQCNRYVLDLRS